jgi:anti-sigma B factor antagonist
MSSDWSTGMPRSYEHVFDAVQSVILDRLSPIRAIAANGNTVVQRFQRPLTRDGATGVRSRGMDDEFQLETYIADDGTFGMRVVGDLDMATADRLVTALQSAPQPALACVVDLGACAFVDSSGIRALLMCKRELDGGAGVLRVVGVRDEVERVFAIAGISEVLQVDELGHDGDARSTAESDDKTSR